MDELYDNNIRNDRNDELLERHDDCETDTDELDQLSLCLPKTEISVFQRPTLACQRRRFPSL